MTPLVSILIPVYKVPEKYLRQCIESCVAQTLREIEVIAVDDGSPDNCGQILDEYAARDSRIKVIHKANGGLSAARNSAFDAATGRYVTFLDGDDYLTPTACEETYNKAEEQGVQMVFWNKYTDFPNKTVQENCMGPEPILFDEAGCKELQLRVLDFNGRIAQVFMKTIRRDFLVEHNIRHVDELSQGAEGFVFNIQLFNHLTSAYYHPSCLMHYVYNEASISHSPSDRNNYLILQCLEFIGDYVKQCAAHKELEQMLLNRVLYVVVTTAITGYFNPYNTDPYSQRKQKFQAFMRHPLVAHAMAHAPRHGLNLQRRFILICIALHLYPLLTLLGKLRRIQLRRGMVGK